MYANYCDEDYKIKIEVEKWVNQYMKG
jgi:hypothetical protein